MATSVSQLLNILIGGVIQPSVQAAFRSLDGMVATSDRRIRSLSQGMGRLGQQMGAMARQAAAYFKSPLFDKHLQTGGLFALAGSAGIGAAARGGSSLESKLLESIITDGASTASLNATRASLAGLSNRNQTGQTMDALQEGMGVFVSANMSLEESMMRLRNAGRVATATGSSVSDIARTELAMKTMFNIVGTDAEDTAMRTQRAWNILATAGKEGSFELRNMAQELTELGSRAQNMGMTGERNLSFVAASLQAQIKNAGDPRTAANNMVNIMDKLNGAPDFAENAKKLGIDMVQLRRQALKNGPDGANIMELFVERFEKVLNRTPAAQRAGVLGQLVQDRQAREGLKAQLTYRQMIADLDAKNRANAAKDVISEDFNKALQASQKSWEAITSSMQKVGQAAVVAFGPALNTIAGMAESASNFILAVTTGHPEIAKWGLGILAVGGAIAALGFKARILGRILSFVGVSRLGGLLTNFPTLTRIASGSFGRLVSVIRGGAGLLARTNIGMFLLNGLRSGMSRLLPLGATIGKRLIGGLGMVLKGGLRLMFSTVGLAAMAAFGGWQIGTWLDEKFGISKKISGWMSEVSGLQARIDAMNKPAMTNDMDAGRLGSLTGDAAQASREAAIKKWNERIAANNAKHAELKSEWFHGDLDKSQMQGLLLDNKLAEAQIAQLRTQLQRQQAGQSTFDATPKGIAAAEARLAALDAVVSKGGREDLTLSDARAMADGLRQQLAIAKAKGTTLSGAAGSSTHVTTLKIDVTGATAPDAGKHVTDMVTAAMRERDKEIARSYRGTVSTGSLGE